MSGSSANTGRASTLASRYPSVVEALFDDVEQAQAALKALENMELGELPPGFERFSLVERRITVTPPPPSGGLLQRLRVLLKAQAPAAQPTVHHDVIVLVRGEAPRLKAAMSVLREYGARSVEIHLHRDSYPSEA